MKIRIGFVSNSSTSSFCIIGIKLGESEELKEIMKSLDIEEENLDDYEMAEMIAEKLGLISQYVCESEDCEDGEYIGLNVKRINAKGTKQIIEEITKADEKIRKFFGDKVADNIHIYSGTYAC